MKVNQETCHVHYIRHLLFIGTYTKMRLVTEPTTPTNDIASDWTR